MEEADIRFAEVKKAQYEFNRDIVSGAVNAVCQQYMLAAGVNRYVSSICYQYTVC